MSFYTNDINGESTMKYIQYLDQVLFHEVE